MPKGEIEVPKDVREFMPEWAKGTVLGYRNGARRQYRYGTLHIREYDDKFLVHADRADPRSDPVGHLIKDAPEIPAGAACALAGLAATRKLSWPLRLAAFAASAYLGYVAVKKLKGE